MTPRISSGDIVLVHCSVNEPILREAWHLRRTLPMTARMRADFDAVLEQRYHGRFGKLRPCVVLDVRDEDEVELAALATFEKRPVANLNGLHQLFAVAVGRTLGHPFQNSAKLVVTPTWPPSEKEKATHYAISRPFTVERDEVVKVWPGYRVEEDDLDAFDTVCERAIDRLHRLTRAQLEMLYQSYDERSTQAWKTKMKLAQMRRNVAKALPGLHISTPTPTNLDVVEAIWNAEQKDGKKRSTLSKLVDYSSDTGSSEPDDGARERLPKLATKVAADEHPSSPTSATETTARKDDNDIDSLAKGLAQTRIQDDSAENGADPDSKPSRVKISISLKPKISDAQKPKAKLALFSQEERDESNMKTAARFEELAENLRKSLEKLSLGDLTASKSAKTARGPRERQIRVAARA